MPDLELLTKLQAENARLIALLESRGIEWRPPSASPALASEPSKLSTGEKVTLFRRLFRGRMDVYPIRWESKTTGKSGYAPTCANEWRAGVCEKPRIKCGDCSNRLLIPISDAVIYGHLAGEHTVGVYPLLEDDSCFFFAVDFDEADWREDARAFMGSCEVLGVPAAIEISRSGWGAHAWVFFAGRVSARDARRLGTSIISHTCARTRQLKLNSYDRLFPNQDTMPKGGFGNLIALPLQKGPRERGCSVFVNSELQPYPDQWAFLAAIRPMDAHDIEPTILRATGGVHPLDVMFIDDEDLATPWKGARTSGKRLSGSMPKSLNVTLANLIYFEKAQLPQALANRLIRLAAFQNPEFYKAQAMRSSVWDKPRVIGCAENFPQHIALPRGCRDAALSLLRENGIGCDLRDERVHGQPLEVNFVGTLRMDQEAAVSAMLDHDAGVLCAPTAFGKTVSAAAIIARRKLWSGNRGRMSSRRRRLLRCDLETDEGEVRARSDGDTYLPRRTAAIARLLVPPKSGSLGHSVASCLCLEQCGANVVPDRHITHLRSDGGNGFVGVFKNPQRFGAVRGHLYRQGYYVRTLLEILRQGTHGGDVGPFEIERLFAKAFANAWPNWPNTLRPRSSCSLGRAGPPVNTSSRF